MSATIPAIEHQPVQQRFIMPLEGGEPAYLEYEMGKDGTLMIMHTEVPFDHGGKGYGPALAKAALQHARDQQLKVMPYCSYIATFLQRHKAEYQSIISPEFSIEK